MAEWRRSVLTTLFGIIAAGVWGALATFMDAPRILVSIGAVLIGAGVISYMSTTNQSNDPASPGVSPYSLGKLDKSAAQRAAKHAAFAGFVMGAITLALIALSINLDAPAAFAQWADPWLVADVLVVVALSIGILRYSRFAATILLLYYLISQTTQVQQVTTTAGTVGRILVVLIFAYFFIQGVRGTFVYHRLRHEEDSAYRPASRWQYILGSAVGIVFVLIVGFGGLINIGIFPSDTVVRGNEMSTTHRTTLREHGILRGDEQIEYFYSGALFSVLSKGNVLTDQRIITYEQTDQNIEVYSLPLRAVVRVDVIVVGTAVSDTVVQIYDTDGWWLKLWLSPIGGGDKVFLEALEKKTGVTANYPESDS